MNLTSNNKCQFGSYAGMLLKLTNCEIHKKYYKNHIKMINEMMKTIREVIV